MNDFGSCPLRRVVDALVAKEASTSFVRHRNWIIGASTDGYTLWHNCDLPPSSHEVRFRAIGSPASTTDLGAKRT